MNDLTIGALTARTVDWPRPDDVDRLLSAVAGDRLEPALAARPLPDGEWCLRRLDVDVRLDPTRPAPALEAAWAQQIVDELWRTLASGSPDVVHYAGLEAAADDLLASLAAGRRDRAWAWRQVGLLSPEDPEPTGEARRKVALRVLMRLPLGPVAALVRLVERSGAAAAHRLLGTEGWQALSGAVAVPGLAGRAMTVADEATAGPSRTEGPGLEPDPAADDRPPAAAAAPSPPATAARHGTTPPDVVRLAGAIATRAALAVALRRSGLRLDDETQAAWAVLAIAEVDPVRLRRPDDEVRALVRAVIERLRPAPTLGLARPSPAGTAGPPQVAATTAPRDVDASSDRAAAAVTVSAPDAVARAGRADAPYPGGAAAPSAVGGRSTAWGGLLFLLNTAALAGLPEALDTPALSSRTTPWCVRQLATRIVPAPDDDAAVVALAGPPTVREPGPGPDEIEAGELDALAERWVEVTGARLRAGAGTAAGRRAQPDEPTRDAADVLRLARRDATVMHDAGWVEVVLDLDDVDLDVRRSGLDIDPGWVWWLGHVVRIRYE
ncbi:hypothetical protein ACWFNE_06805 [Cellulomonas sp. NPDC055163]